MSELIVDKRRNRINNDGYFQSNTTLTIQWAIARFSHQNLKICKLKDDQHAGSDCWQLDTGD
jgi:hypothetical protein